MKGVKKVQVSLTKLQQEEINRRGWQTQPIHWGRFWYYKDYIYDVTGGPYSSEEEIKLLILEAYDEERRLFERLKIKFSETEPSSENNSRRIPEKVRIEVWRRDGGKCARCGSREKFEYDHIVPFSKGGSNTARNVELLCESCNRSKHNNIA
jgi:hypothetical protein